MDQSIEVETVKQSRDDSREGKNKGKEKKKKERGRTRNEGRNDGDDTTLVYPSAQSLSTLLLKNEHNDAGTRRHIDVDLSVLTQERWQ